MGITVKSQSAVWNFPAFHNSVKIAPINQKWVEGWYAAHPEHTPVRDLFNNLYIALGAGLPNGQDSTLNCAVPGLDFLVADTNRDGDVNKPARRWTELPVSEAEEHGAIQRLLEVHERYTDNAGYSCLPELFAGFYNSNSYARSLLYYADIPHDSRQPRFPSPGWLTLIPEHFFPPK